MLDPDDGTLRFDLPDVTITRDLTKVQFLAGPLAAGAKPLNQNAPWARFAFQRVTIGDATWAGDICFNAGRLHFVSLAVVRPEFGSSWDDWSEEKELARKAFHDAILKSIFSPAREQHRFAWGTVESAYDAKGGGSAIHIHYKP